MKKYVIALDSGTTSCRAILFDKQQNIVNVSQKEFQQLYTQDGWVEHNANEIWATQLGVLKSLIGDSKIKINEVDSIGITNQRETVVIWDKKTGKPIYNAIVWQCRRTAEYCEVLKEDGWGGYISATTGLVVDAYFSATKIKWILVHVPGSRERAKKGELLFGTIDTWLLWNLTNGEAHLTDYTNASRTMIFDIQKLEWDDKLLTLMDIPREILPTVQASSSYFGSCQIENLDIPICGIAGDQQAAFFGQACFEKGDVKNTYGTGCFMLMNLGKKFIRSSYGVLTTIGIGLKDNIEYAFEGSVFVGGASIQWLRDELKFIEDSKDSEYFATKVSSSGGVYVVPAFVGLGTPYWDMYARGAILGLTRSTNYKHIIRATLESIAYQSRDLLEAMVLDSGLEVEAFRVDGGASNNNFLMQFQADIVDKLVQRPKITETTALGAAYLSGLHTNFWSFKEIKENWSLDREFRSSIDEEKRENLYANWKKAVQRSLNWLK